MANTKLAVVHELSIEMVDDSAAFCSSQAPYETLHAPSSKRKNA